MKRWKTLQRQTVLNHSKFLIVENHTVELPDGQIISEWPWVITPDFVNIVAVTEEGRFLCFRQIKYAVDDTTLALPGGYIEPGEEPRPAAERELLEETGYEAVEWIELGHYRIDGNRGVGLAYFYLALGVHRVSEPDPDDLEEQQLLHLSRVELEAALITGEFKVVTWAAAVGLALLRLKMLGRKAIGA